MIENEVVLGDALTCLKQMYEDIEDLIYLDSYRLQQDMRIRLPKCILENLNAEKGVTLFNIYFDKTIGSIVLKPAVNNQD